ncbi:MAG: hypothetical protein ACRDTC_01820 [Pseudonocardiaceae bacterium]
MPAAKNLSGYQASHGLLCEELRGWLVNALERGVSTPDGSEPPRWRECAVVYSLLRVHVVDRKGRCRLCRCPQVMFGRRRRRCRVHVVANFYLRQPEEFVRSHLAGELDGSVSQPSRWREAIRKVTS